VERDELRSRLTRSARLISVIAKSVQYAQAAARLELAYRLDLDEIAERVELMGSCLALQQMFDCKTWPRAGPQDEWRRCASLRNYFATKTIFSLSMIAGGCDMTSFTMASRVSPGVGSNS